jgi:hypothetical protein
MSLAFLMQEWELGAQLVAAFSEAHRYEMNLMTPPFPKREWELLGAQLVLAVLVADRYVII